MPKLIEISPDFSMSRKTLQERIDRHFPGREYWLMGLRTDFAVIQFEPELSYHEITILQLVIPELFRDGIF